MEWKYNPAGFSSICRSSRRPTKEGRYFTAILSTVCCCWATFLPISAPPDLNVYSYTHRLGWEGAKGVTLIINPYLVKRWQIRPYITDFPLVRHWKPVLQVAFDIREKSFPTPWNHRVITPRGPKPVRLSLVKIHICANRILRWTRGSMHCLKYSLKFQGLNNQTQKKFWLHKYEFLPPISVRALADLPHHVEKFCTKERRTGFGHLGVIALCL